MPTRWHNVLQFIPTVVFYPPQVLCKGEFGKVFRANISRFDGGEAAVAAVKEPNYGFFADFAAEVDMHCKARMATWHLSPLMV